MGKKLWEKAGLVGLPGAPAAGSGAPGSSAGGATGGAAAAPASGGTAGAAAMMVGGAAVMPASAEAARGAGAGAGLAVGAGGVGGGQGHGVGHGPAQGAAPGGAAGVGHGLGPGLGSGAEVGSARAKTAPGTMLGFMTAQSAAIQEAEQLRQRLAAYDGAQPARLLPAAAIRASAWANRHDASFADPSFEQLKSEIASAGGNVQPIKVRPLPGPAAGVGPSNPGASNAVGTAAAAGLRTAPQTGPQTAPPTGLPATGAPVPVAYEIVFGHRRHRACLELGLPVLAVVEPLSEQQLFEQMERENRARKDLSAWEQGMMYARALDQGLYPSNRQLALAIGKDLGDLGKALALARLPLAVVEAFKSPLDLQYRWAKPLADAQQQDPDGLITRALELKGRQGGLQARQIFEALVASPALAAPAPKPVPREQLIKRGRRTLAVLSWEPDGRTRVVVQAALDEAQRQRLAQALEACLGDLAG